MGFDTYPELEALALKPEALERTYQYLAAHLERFVKRNERVLICFGKDEDQMLGSIFERAVRQTGGVPLMWGPDFRWKTLLRQAFSSRATVIIGPPLVVLGLSKLVKATATPLNIRHVVTAGYPCLDWMIDGIVKGLDCGTWGCFGPGTGAVVGGFSCGSSRGVHLRTDAYAVDIVGPDGEALADGEIGRIRIRDLSSPEHACLTLDQGRIERTPCSCGQPSPRLVDIFPHSRHQKDMEDLGQMLQSWTSILDCRLAKGPCGLEMELVVFPGEKLPKLPTCAKRIIRPWDPEMDVPFGLENMEHPIESH